MKFFLLLIISFNLYGKGKTVFPIGSSEVKKYLEHVKHVDPLVLGFDQSKAIVQKENSEGSAMIRSGSVSVWVYDIDITNDGNKDYLAIHVYGGSMRTSGLLSIMSAKKEFIRVDKMISKSLWKDDSGDLSKFHLWMAFPAIVKKNNLNTMRFYDRMPKAKFTEYIIKNGKFVKTNEYTTNTF